MEERLKIAENRLAECATFRERVKWLIENSYHGTAINELRAKIEGGLLIGVSESYFKEGVIDLKLVLKGLDSVETVWS